MIIQKSTRPPVGGLADGLADKIQNDEIVKILHFTLLAPYARHRFVVLGSFFILIFAFSIFAARVAYASETNGTIIVDNPNAGYAWSDRAGWMNFGATNGNINITDLPAGQAGSGIVGYAWNANYGWINMSPTNGGVLVAANGALSGYAWGSGLGWINFSGVSINSSGKFVGTASGANIGTLTFDCANCSVNTDFRPQNFRTAIPIQTPPSSGGGGGSGIIVGGSIPDHLNAYNVPLVILPQQSGTLEQIVSNGKRVIFNIPKNSVSFRTAIIIHEEILVPGLNLSLLPENADLLNATFYNIIARDDNGALVTSFANDITITLPVPELLQQFLDIGIYWLDEAGTNVWRKVPNAVFSADNSTANFRVNHLTKFGIFRIFSKFTEPSVSPVVPEMLKPRQSMTQPSVIGSSGMTEIKKEEERGVFEGGVPEEIREEFLPAQLFDINLEIENTKIAGLKDLVARVLFTSFGRVPTPVDLTFDILNESGEKVYSAKDGITVQTQAVLTKRFADAEEILEIGKYTLLTTTLYNTDVVDEFRQDFEIAGGEAIKKPFWRSLWFWGISTIALIIIFFVVAKRLKDEEEDEGDNSRLLKNG